MTLSSPNAVGPLAFYSKQPVITGEWRGAPHMLRVVSTGLVREIRLHFCLRSFLLFRRRLTGIGSACEMFFTFLLSGLTQY